MIRLNIVWVIILTLMPCSAKEKPIIVIVPSHNNREVCEKNLNSICSQQYASFHVLYIDDASTDGTAHAVAAYIKQMNLQEQVTLIRNPVRRGALYSIYLAIECCPNDVIILIVDGDDYLIEDDTTILQRINDIYDDPEVWMTYGQFQEYPSGTKGFCRPIPEQVHKAHAYRYYDWVSSHLKTFYAGLFRAIPVGHFIRNGMFLRSACDLAFMIPMLELSGGRAHCINEVLYVYNTSNTINVFKTRPFEQIKNSYWIRSRTPLDPLSSHPAGQDLRNAVPVYNIHISTRSPEQCRAYLTTLSFTDINNDHVIVWYTAPTLDLAHAYEEIAIEFHITAYHVNPDCPFKNQLIHSIENISSCGGILLTCDGCQWHAPWSSREAMQMITRTGALCYACSRGIELLRDDFIEDRASPCVMLKPSVWAWKPHESRGLWLMPYGVPGIVCTQQTATQILTTVRGDTMAQCLQHIMLLPAFNEDDLVLCGITPHATYTMENVV